MGILRITLKSDLCASSGQAFSSVVDSDIVTDSFGLPYIPARRIKGCLRDAAKYLEKAKAIDPITIDALFGCSGQGTASGSDPNSIKIGNGYLENHETLRSVLAERKGIPAQRVTELFTAVKSQTAIENDTVKTGSLRYTRTLSHYLPYSKAENGEHSETVFLFSVKGVTDEHSKAFESICKALRHIGLMRTRGLGAVKAEYTPDSDKNAESTTEAENSMQNEKAKISDPVDGKHILPLHIRLAEPLLIAAQNNTACLEYVPGTAVLGAFARLAVNAGWTDDEIEETFLSGKVKFGNLYISDENGSRTVPAPHFIKKLKVAGTIVNELTEECDPAKDTPKTLKGKCVLANELTKKADVRTETTYHHSRGDNALLYTQDSICEGQYLYGEIESGEENKQLLEELAELLKTGDLRFGRSKTAQYSAGEVLEVSRHERSVGGEKGEKTVFALESDAIILDENGVNTIEPEALKNALIKALELKDGNELNVLEYDLSFKYIHGYNSKRNLRNIPMAAIAMGSTVTVKGYNGNDWDLRIGIRNSEGFGVVRVYSGFGGKTQGDGKDETGAKTKNAPVIDDSVKISFIELLNKQTLSAKGIEITSKYFGSSDVCSAFSESRLNSAFVGVVSRMIETASSTEEALDRVRKIKDNVKQEQIDKILKGLIKALSEDAELHKICEDDESEFDQIKRDCMITLLRLAKYRIKREKNGGK